MCVFQKPLFHKKIPNRTTDNRVAQKENEVSSSTIYWSVPHILYYCAVAFQFNLLLPAEQQTFPRLPENRSSGIYGDWLRNVLQSPVTKNVFHKCLAALDRELVSESVKVKERLYNAKYSGVLKAYTTHFS